MIITLRNFIPMPLTGSPNALSSFWGSESIEFRSGLSYLVTAPSGKGKTSLVSMIFGMRKDYQGSILIDGTDCKMLSLAEWSEIRKRKISFIFQGLELFDELTALENIRIKNRLLDYKTESEIRKMAESLEMDTFLDRETGKLSFGQRQRVAVIRSLCQPFDFLFADEIFSHLEKKLEKMTFGMIRAECGMNKAGLIMTSLHPLEEFTFDIHLSI